MKCKKVKRLLPLFVGDDLSIGKMSRLKNHLDRCSACQQELHSYVMSLDKTREWLTGDRVDWQTQEWEDALEGAVKGRPSRVSPLSPWPFRKSWAYALMALLAVVITVFVVRPIRVDLGKEREMYTSSRIPSRILTEKVQQQVVSMTLVSRETGLKITWFFNKDFNFKEEK